MSYKTPEARRAWWREYSQKNRELLLARQREQRKRYQGRCVVCGKPTDGSNGRAKAPKHCADHNPSQKLAPCGTRSAYNRGCRCTECRAAQATYMRAWKARRKVAV